MLNLYKTFGIYVILNVITDQFYIGSSAGRSGFKGRWNTHKYLLRNNKHTNPKLQNSWNKYGEESFKFEVVEIGSKNTSLVREQYYLDLLNPHLNILKNATSRLGSKLSAETIEKLKGRIPWNKGHKKPKKFMSPELKAISKANAQIKKRAKMLGRKIDPEIVEKIAVKRRIPVIATHLITRKQTFFSGVRVAARTLNLDVSMISKVCKKKHSYYKDWTFHYGS